MRLPRCQDINPETYGRPDISGLILHSAKGKDLNVAFNNTTNSHCPVLHFLSLAASRLGLGSCDDVTRRLCLRGT